MATCSYNTEEISPWWAKLTINASYAGCSLDSWLRCTNNPLDTCRVDLSTLFIGALNDFSNTSTKKNECQSHRFVTEISCKCLPFHGYLFTNSNACTYIADGKYSEVKKQLVSNCKCNCGKKYNVYCKSDKRKFLIVGTTSGKSKFASLVQYLNSTEFSTTLSTGSSKTSSSSQTTATSLPSSQSEAFSVHDASVSKSSASSAATIGGVVGGVVGLAVIALLLLILIRRRKTSRRESKNPDQHANSGAYTNKAYHHTENMVESVNTHLNTNKQMASDRQSSFHDYQQLDGNGEHEYAISNYNGKPDEYDYVKTTTVLPSSTMTITAAACDSENYDFATPIQQNNYFVLEPETQQNSVGDYFVLEKDNYKNKADDCFGTDNLYNSLNEKHKTEDSGDDEYHHLREINKQAGLETGDVTKSDTNNYDVLANVSNYKKEVANDDYDHCKPRKVSECNQEDDYDHFN